MYFRVTIMVAQGDQMQGLAGGLCRRISQSERGKVNEGSRESFVSIERKKKTREMTTITQRQMMESRDERKNRKGCGRRRCIDNFAPRARMKPDA